VNDLAARRSSGVRGFDAGRAIEKLPVPALPLVNTVVPEIH
jgi:hypothetical protein